MLRMGAQMSSIADAVGLRVQLQSGRLYPFFSYVMPLVFCRGFSLELS